MTAPVDVLAVLNHHANGFSNGPVTLSETGAANLANELRQARAAVAELIDAGEQAHAFLCEKAPASATEYRLRASIASAKGGAA